MGTQPLVIQQGHRRAVIDGKRVSLLRLQNKRKPAPVWPEMEVTNPEDRFSKAFLWVRKGFVDFTVDAQ